VPEGYEPFALSIVISWDFDRYGGPFPHSSTSEPLNEDGTYRIKAPDVSMIPEEHRTDTFQYVMSVTGGVVSPSGELISVSTAYAGPGKADQGIAVSFSASDWQTWDETWGTVPHITFPDNVTEITGIDFTVQVPDRPAEFFVGFDANGGVSESEITADGPLSAGDSYVVPGSMFTRDGYTFDGWLVESQGGSVRYNVGQSFTITGNVTLVAMWVATEKDPVDPGKDPVAPAKKPVAKVSAPTGGSVLLSPVEALTDAAFAMAKVN
jgi:uncharacterized repeat protein (TIGR02543 family)